MSQNKEILLICGGGGSEHEISLITAKYLKDNLVKDPDISVRYLEIGKDKVRRDEHGNSCELRKAGELITPEGPIKLNYAIPCFHGYPGETGDIQSLFEMMELPYLGSGPEASKICFNKVTTKLWLDALNIPNTPFLFLTKKEQWEKINQVLPEWGNKAFIKASSQGSSVGCYLLEDPSKSKELIEQAFQHSPYVLVEKALKPRELEVATYIYNGELIVSDPSEVISPTGVYTYEEKYGNQSQAKTLDRAEGLSVEIVDRIKMYAKEVFHQLKINHLARIDFFYTSEGELYLNEVNTFPGMTPISMFPKMLQANGHDFSKFLTDIIHREARL